MVALLKSVAAIAAATNVRIVDSLGGHAFDLSNNHCINLQPVQAAAIFNPAIPHQQALNIADAAAGTFKIVHSACNFPITYGGSTTGAEPLRAGLVVVKGSPTTFRVVPADPTIPSGPFKSVFSPRSGKYCVYTYILMAFSIIENTSGLALTNWRFNPGTIMYSPASARVSDIIHFLEAAAEYTLRTGLAERGDLRISPGVRTGWYIRHASCSMNIAAIATKQNYKRKETITYLLSQPPFWIDRTNPDAFRSTGLQFAVPAEFIDLGRSEGQGSQVSRTILLSKISRKSDFRMRESESGRVGRRWSSREASPTKVDVEVS
ncbi:hypothetical protein C8J57DRAFT_1234497 [Mycena rebaudengoi]|nr:hypothetical protein C8J57DRAFT_1234497 [Mycena rebaudengoi]